MKISGFTIARNAVKFGYPLEESIRSLLPLVNELVIGIDDTGDSTWDLVASIQDPKIKAFRSQWDMGMREGGKVLSTQTNKALSRCGGDWGVYLQADEVLHEDDLERVRRSLQRVDPTGVEGLRFEYYHFYGSFQTVQDHPRKWYRHGVRAVRLGVGVESAGDAYGFKIRAGKRARSLRKADSGAHIYHYGWARPPEVMLEKQQNLDRMYHDEEWLASHYAGEQEKVRQFYRDLGHLKFFRGSHPRVMEKLVARQDWTFKHGIENQKPDWLRHLYIWLVYPAVKKIRHILGR